MKKTSYISVLFLIIIATFFSCSENVKTIENKAKHVSVLPKIYPDYTQITIPLNIAPLNFIIEEKGSKYQVKIYSKKGKSISIKSKKPQILIPLTQWTNLLKDNIGSEIFIDVYVKKSGEGWLKFKTIVNSISKESIDGYLVYRLLPSVYKLWQGMKIIQRNVSCFEEKVLIDKRSFGSGCVNCHTFNQNSTERITFQIRGPKGGMILVTDSTSVEKIKISPSPAYMSWHPSGNLSAFATIKVTQFYHSFLKEPRDVIDLNSSIGIYSPKTNKTFTIPQLSKPDYLETYPAWSPDGHYLYFSSAKMFWNKVDRLPPNRYKEVKYDLKRIKYDYKQDKWGELETVLSSKKTNKTILQSKISPDGKYLLFSMCDYGCFPVFHEESDLYLLNLQTNEYKPFAGNSDYTDSWHSWSSNSRWVVFSSKRSNGIYSRLYFSHIDEDGNATKPFVLPQKDPTLYNFLTKTYNLPELIKESVKIKSKKLLESINSMGKKGGKLPITSASPKK